MQHAQAEAPMPAPSTLSSARRLARPTSLQAMLLLGGLGTLNILWSDMLFPTITSIQQDLGTSATAVQQTVSLFFVANAFMCLWHGVLSDAWGRRKPLFIGLVVLVLTSLLSLLATRIEHLWVLRTVQGLVVGLGHVLCRAVIRDLYSGMAAQKMMANTTLVQSAGTIVLPMLGGWLTWMWGWRAVFAFLSAVGVMLLLVYARHLPESLPPERRQAIRPDRLGRNYRLVLGSPWFMRLTLAHSCNWAALFLYVAAAPQLLTHSLGRSPTDVYLILTPMMAGLSAGFLYLPRLVQRWGTQRTLYLAYAGFVFVTVLNAALGELVPPSLIHLLPIAAYALAIGLSMPLLVGHALQPFPDNAGLAASCQMFLQYSMMAVAAGLLAPLLWDSLSHLALGCGALICISMTLLLWQRYATHKTKRSYVPSPLASSSSCTEVALSAVTRRCVPEAPVTTTCPLLGSTSVPSWRNGSTVATRTRPPMEEAVNDPLSVTSACGTAPSVAVTVSCMPGS